MKRIPLREPNCGGEIFDKIIGSSSALESVLAEVERVASTDSTVLVLGETGTGKELIAQAIHHISPRCGRPFVRLNCSAIPFDLLESELFGHEKGAFTGAIAQKIGRFELADTGTLFLDEIGDLPLALQPKLLRVLQEQEFERVGSVRTHRINVRLVAATHRDLTEMVERAEFRRDLYYRLNVFPLVLPPLRERREDIAPLLSHFVEILARRMGRQIHHIPKETLDAFTSYSWPGNVRELQNLVERAVIRSNNGVLWNPMPMVGKNHVTLFPLEPNLKDADRGRATQGKMIIPAAVPIAEKAPVSSDFAQSTLMETDRALILRTLEATGWVIGGPAGAATRLGLKRTTLIGKMKKLGISRPAPASQSPPNEISRHLESDRAWQAVE
ncbi:MAG TPA: sigma 54-interacting transcriptional regulator [Terriglobales bacterium]